MSSSRSSWPGASASLATPDAQARKRFGYLLTKIASNAPAPASGSAAAAVVATAAALLQKVALRSRSRWSGAGAVHDRAEAVRLRAQELVELDASAFLDFMSAARSGRDVESARQRTIDVPGEIATLAAEVVILAKELELRGNPNLRADAVAAGILAEAARATATMLLRVNESAGPPASPGRAGGRGRAPARSRGTDPPSPRRTARGGRQAGSSGRRQGS